MKNIAILQPGYLPWLGFFEQLYRCDVFVFLDDVKYTKLDWRNRNRIKTPEGAIWLTVPVFMKGSEEQKIYEAKIDNTKKWQVQHWRTIEVYYSKAKYFGMYFEEFKSFYKKKYKFISELDVDLILWINEKIGLNRKVYFSSQLNITITDKQDRLIEICKNFGSTHFYDGKAAQNFIDTDYFLNQGITVEFQDYNHPYYNQLWVKEQGFISHVSIIDLLFNHGPESLDILSGNKVITQPDGVSIRSANGL